MMFDLGKSRRLRYLILSYIKVTARVSATVALVLGVLSLSPAVAQKEGSKAAFVTKIGVVRTERILREATPVKAAYARVEAEFKKRDEELQRLAGQLRTKVTKFDKEAPVLLESDRVKRQRELGSLDAELQRRRREFQDDLNRRRNEEFSVILEKVHAVIKRIAEQENYDLILQDAVAVSSRVDITDQVIKGLGK
jgi:outer membrane protein